MSSGASSVPITRALLIRSHNPSIEAIRRLACWITSINACPELGMEIWFSVDTTTLRNRRKSAQPSFMYKHNTFAGRKRRAVESRSPVRNITSTLSEDGLLAGTHYHIHEYCEDDMVRSYPVLKEMARHPTLLKTEEFTRGTVSLAWGFHAEALTLWFRQRQSGARLEDVWVFEDDVAWAGKDIAKDFFLHFQDERADLISADCSRFNHQWWWSTVFSAACGERIPEEARRNSREHVQRFSRKLLDRLHDLATAGCSGWSEAWSVSVCTAEPDLEFALLPKRFLGAPYCYDGRVSKSQWDDVMNDRSARFRDKLYHALKW